MNIELDRKWLLSAVKTANSVVNKRSPKEVLTRTLLQLADGKATVHGTDTETSVSVSTPISASEWSKALLPVQCVQFLDSSDSETVEISTSENATVVKCGHSKITLNTENPDEYPIPKITPKEDVTKVDGKAFQKALKQVLYATDEDAQRFALAAIKLEDSAQGLLCIATDGRRLSCSEIESISVGGLSVSSLLPCKAAKAVLGMHLDEAWLWESGPNICLSDSDGSTLFSARMVEGRYPNWRQVLPKLDDYYKAVVARDALLRVIKQAAIAADGETRAVDFRFQDGNLLAAAKATELGSSAVQMPIEFEGDVTMRLDYRFVADFVEHADETLEIHVKNDRNPAYLVSGEYRGVVMPMALEG